MSVRTDDLASCYGRRCAEKGNLVFNYYVFMRQINDGDKQIVRHTDKRANPTRLSVLF